MKDKGGCAACKISIEQHWEPNRFCNIELPDASIKLSVWIFAVSVSLLRRRREYHHSWQMWCVCLDIWGENGGVGSCWWLPPTFTSSSPLTLVPPTSCQPPPAHPHLRQSSQASKFPLYQGPSWQPGHWCGNVEPILGEGSAPIIGSRTPALRGVRALRWNSWGWSRQSKPQFGSVAFSSIGSYSAQKV